MPSKTKKCSKCKKGTLDHNNFCNAGCDYVAAREDDCTQAERKVGVKYGEPFFMYKGITLVASDGGEEPTLTIKVADTTIELREKEVRILIQQLQIGEKWCEEGYCQGIY